MTSGDSRRGAETNARDPRQGTPLAKAHSHTPVTATLRGMGRSPHYPHVARPGTLHTSKGSGCKSRLAPTRLKEHRYRAPSIVARPLLEMGTAMTEICAHLKTACQKLFSVRISMFLCPLRADAPLRGWRRAAGKALQTLRAMPGRAPLALQSWISSDGIGIRLILARQQRPTA